MKSAKLKFFATKIGSGKTPLGGAEAYVADGVMLLRSQNVHFDGLHLDDVVFITEETDESMSNSRVQGGDVLLNITGASLGRCTVAPKELPPSNVNQHVCIIRCDESRLSGRFLSAALQSHPIQAQIWGDETGSSREGLNFEQVGAFPIPIRPLPEQRRIAEYLDSQTSRIDALVADKERMLGLLEEKRSAEIRRAVTRGLDNHTTLKPSGYPWLGDIPKHWDAKRSKRLLIERDDRSETGEEEMLTVSHLTGVTPRSEKDVNMFEAESNEGYKLVSPDNLVINTLWAWMGAMGVARHEGLVSPAYHVYRITAELLPAYVDYLVRTDVFKAEVTRFSKGVWSSRLRLYPEGLHEVWLPVPPLPEQRAIVAHLKAERERTAELEATLRSSIELLHERRRALITAAVTGQIKPEAMTA